MITDAQITANMEIPPSGYAIHVVWIGPLEGYEYRVYLMGTPNVLAYRKSWKAAVGFARRHSHRESGE